jgi:D-aminoacyl-tRNA deacylase
MRAVIQRVTRAEVRSGGKLLSRIGPGLLVFVGIGLNDSAELCRRLAEKILTLRILNDEGGKMNRSILETGGGILCVSQFTLFGDARRGRRPSYTAAAPPAAAAPLYDRFVEELRLLAASQAISVQSGQFQAVMDVELVNDGPVTILVDTDRTF